MGGQGASIQVADLKATQLTLYPWMKEMASALPLRLLVDDSKCNVGVAGPMEKDKLVGQRQTRLG